MAKVKSENDNKLVKFEGNDKKLVKFEALPDSKEIQKRIGVYMDIKSQDKYIKQYSLFRLWKDEYGYKGEASTDEQLQEYMVYLKNDRLYAPSSIMSWISMIKTCVVCYEGIKDAESRWDASLRLAKNWIRAHNKKKSNVFTADDISSYLGIVFVNIFCVCENIIILI